MDHGDQARLEQNKGMKKEMVIKLQWTEDCSIFRSHSTDDSSGVYEEEILEVSC